MKTEERHQLHTNDLEALANRAKPFLEQYGTQLIAGACAILLLVGGVVWWNSSSSAENAAGTEATLKAAGLGDFHHGTTLFLRGDAPDGSGKDGRRAMISANYCVIALAGDQLGDIADIFNAKDLAPPARKALTDAPVFGQMWGNGWFILPNPLYGPSIKGTMDEVFPPETYWQPEATE